MAKANVILLNSILWNLREISNLAEMIKKHCGDVDCASWRYPLISCSEIEIFKLLQSNRNLDNYTFILELTYDRLLYIFNLIIKFMESHDSMEKFRPDKNVRRPKMLSLASVLCMIWDRIKGQMELITQPKSSGKKEAGPCEGDVEIGISRSTTYTQSEMCSISICSCCEMAQEFVTQIVLEMEKVLEKHDSESAITAERKIMKSSLVDMTNWSAMSKWLGAIEKDLKTISEKSEQEALSSRKLRHRIDSGERKMKSKTEQFEDEIRRLGERLREYESKISHMKEEMDHLVKQKNQLSEEIKIKSSQLISENLNFERKTEELKRSCERRILKIKEKKTKKEMEREKEWTRKLECEVKKREAMESECEKLKECLLEMKQNMDAANLIFEDEKNSLTNRKQELDKELNDQKEENSRLNQIISQKQNVIEDYSRRLMEAFPQLNGVSVAAYKASGNPQVDMENQIEANNLRMESLKSENEKLRKTLNRIKALKE